MRERIVERLAAGEIVRGYRESGNSMTPIIEHRQPVDLAPIVDPTRLRRGDIVEGPGREVGRDLWNGCVRARAGRSTVHDGPFVEGSVRLVKPRSQRGFAASSGPVQFVRAAPFHRRRGKAERP